MSYRAGLEHQGGEQREDQITIFSQQGGGSGQLYGGGWAYFPHTPLIAFDPDDYPVNSAFRFEMYQDGDYRNCMRLWNQTDYAAGGNLAPVAGSEVCGSGRVRSDPFQMPEGEHEYGLEFSCGLSACFAFEFKAARIIVEWTEPSPPVGGTIELLPSFSRSAGQNYAVLVGLAVVALVAFSAGGWYARRRWLK